MVKRIFVVLLLVSASAFAQEQQFASLGDFKLDSGEVLKDCRIGYRTYGKLNDEKSNIILFPTWAGGTTEQLAGNFGPGSNHLVDTSKYYVIAVDALSNGVSSSPSNSKLQPHMHFPKITIRDMVNTQHELLTRVLGIKHVAVVMGISMGGMQTFQWVVSYPDFMDKAIPIVGSPQMTAFDILNWKTQIDSVKNDPGWNHGDYTQNPSGLTDAEFGMLFLTTPDNVNRTHKADQVLTDLKKQAAQPGQDANNKIRQSEAMMALDVAKDFGGSLDAAAHSVKAKMLVIASKYDHTVNPSSAEKFAKAIDAPVVELTGDCGHLATACEAPKVAAAAHEFLER